MPDLWIKQCGVSHTGSFKDLGMTVLVSVVKQMISEGRPIRAVACASTGDTSAALAAYGAAAGIPVVVLLPRGKVSTAQLVQPLANGALVLALDTDFDGCMRVVQQLTEDKKLYLANSMNSLRVEGQKTVGIEMVQQFDWEVPDWVFIPGGNLGNVSAIAKGFSEAKRMGMIDRMPRLVCCQAERANPLYRAFERAKAAGRALEIGDFEAVVAESTLASAIQIGNPVSLPKAVKALVETDGLVLQASEAQLANASARADRTGLFSCPHTGVALACLEQLAESGVIRRDDRVVLISTAHGLKFTEFKTAYHDVSVDVHLSGRTVDLVSEGFDVAIRAGRLRDSTLVAKKVRSLEAGLFAAPAYLARTAPIRTPADLAAHEMVLFKSKDHRLTLRLVGPRDATASVEVRGRINTDDFAFVRGALRSGCGVGILPRFLGHGDQRDGRLVQVLPGWIPNPGGQLHLVYPAAQHVPAKVIAFRDLLLERASAIPL